MVLMERTSRWTRQSLAGGSHIIRRPARSQCPAEELRRPDRWLCCSLLPQTYGSSVWHVQRRIKKGHPGRPRRGFRWNSRRVRVDILEGPSNAGPGASTEAIRNQSGGASRERGDVGVSRSRPVTTEAVVPKARRICWSSTGGPARSLKLSRLLSGHTGNPGALGTVRCSAMVGSYTRSEQLNSSSNLGESSTTPTSHRLG